jgi:uncharacterized protein YndB with AHSA1/START domain
MPNKSNQTAKSNNDLLIERSFNAPRKLVWKAWTDPETLRGWWGPKGVTNPVCEIDVRPQGVIHIIMLAGKELGELEGNEWPMKGVVQEVIEPEKLVFTSAAIVNNKPILENLVTLTLKEDGNPSTSPRTGKTKMTLHVMVTKTTPEAAGPLAGMKQGWSQSIDKLANLLNG